MNLFLRRYNQTPDKTYRNKKGRPPDDLNPNK